MLKNVYVRNVLSALTVPVFGAILLNLTFLFDFLVQSLIRQLTIEMLHLTNDGLPLINHLVFVAIILLISWVVFKSRLAEIYKAVFLAVPLAVVLATTGIFLYRWPVIVYCVSALILGALMFYLWRTKKSWLYYYTAILVASTLLIISILGVDI